MSPELDMLLLDTLVVLGSVHPNGSDEEVIAFLDARAALVVRIGAMLAKLERVGGEE